MENTENKENNSIPTAREEAQATIINAVRHRLERTLDEIKDWNIETFPDANQSGQLMKLEEELHEYVDVHGEGENSDKELADVMIVCAGLRRWGSLIGQHILAMILAGANASQVNALLDLVDDKMARNRSRVWLKDGDGKYHHDVKLDEPANANGENEPA